MLRQGQQSPEFSVYQLETEFSKELKGAELESDDHIMLLQFMFEVGEKASIDNLRVDIASFAILEKWRRRYFNKKELLDILLLNRRAIVSYLVQKARILPEDINREWIEVMTDFIKVKLEKTLSVENK